MNNEHSVLYNPHIYNEIIKLGRDLINKDIEIIGEQNVVFSNTDSIGFISDTICIESLIEDLNSRYTFLKYKIENQFSSVKFINVNKYIGLCSETNELVIKGFVKELAEHKTFRSMVTSILCNPSCNMLDLDFDPEDPIWVIKHVSNFINDVNSGPIVE